MTTAQDLINSAAKKAGILAQGQALESGVNDDALTTLNRMLARFQNNGIDFGLSTLVAADTVYVDESDEEAIELQFQLRLMVAHRRPISPGLSEAGRDAMTELQAKYTKIKTMRLDTTIIRRNTYLGRSSFNINLGE